MRAHFPLIAAVALALATPADAQDAPLIQLGATVKGTASKGASLYRIAGLAGTSVSLNLVSGGTATLVLYTPEGDEMLTATGDKGAKIEAILPLDAVYHVSVVAAESGEPFSLTANGETPDPLFREWATLVGYEIKLPYGPVSQCWIEPGFKIKEIYPDGTIVTSAIGREGRSYRHYVFPDGGTENREVRYTVEGDEIVKVDILADGTTRERRNPIYEAPGEERRFTGYHCA